MDFLQHFEPSESAFMSIAEQLIKNYAISANGNVYRLMEIEFYWHDEGHKDKSTYSRKHKDPDNGQWFFHYSGVDIALKNNQGYGGILIRAIAEEGSIHKLIRGPMVVAMVLFSGYSVMQAIDTKFIYRPMNMSDGFIQESARKGLGNNASESGFADKLYRFELKI